MKKIIFTLLLSLFSFQTWACSCFFEDYSFTGIWTTYIEDGWNLPHVAECVAVQYECEGLLYVVNKVIHEGDMTGNIAIGDTIRTWNGDGGLCVWNPTTAIGDTVMVALHDFANGEYISDLFGCTDADIDEYENYYIDICGPGIHPVSNGNVGNTTYEWFEAFIAESLTWEVTRVNLTVLLEGSYDEVGNIMNSMPWEQSAFPLAQPFNVAPYNYAGTESIFQWKLYDYLLTDWVLVEARSGTPQVAGEKGTETVETVVGFINIGGQIVDIDGYSPLKFRTLDLTQTYHFCVRHRNHLDVLTATAFPVNEDVNYDFTTSVDQAFGSGQQKWNNDGTKALMYVGDFNQDGIIQISDFDAWKASPAQLNVYSPLDGTLDGTVQVTDYDVWLPNKAKIGVVEIGF